MSKFLQILVVAACLGSVSGPAFAQSADVSPVLLLESVPSDNPNYRRMVFVKYLSGNHVSVNYQAYNRAEFKQVPNVTSDAVIRNCANGPATSLRDIKAFAKTEAKRRQMGQAPEIVHFCIKNVSKWEGGARDRYLDPIFEGLPFAAALNQ